MSLFITFEGGEGSGKSVQAGALYRRLAKMGVPAILTHEPGVTPLGKRIARWLKWGDNVNIAPITELILFNASRAQLVAEVIKPGLASGKVVICDRFADSTTAYQSYGRGLELKTVEAANKAATQGLKPDLTILLDVGPDIALARKDPKRKLDRFEREALDFHQRVREGYLHLAAAEPRRWLVIDGCLPRTKVAEIIWQRISQLLARR